MKYISSHDNPEFKGLKRLCQEARTRKKQKTIVLEGFHLIEAFHARYGALQKIVLAEGATLQHEIANFIREKNNTGQLFSLSAGLFKALSLLETPSGILGIGAMPSHAEPLPENEDALLIDSVQDPGNLGSMIRSAAAAGVRHILLSQECVDVWSPKVLRAGMGAHFQVLFHENVNMLAFLQGYPCPVYVTTLSAGATPIYRYDYSGSCAWVLGHEGQGVRAEIVKHPKSRPVFIPMPGGAESLNVGAATAICLFEAVRQREARA